MAVQYGASAQTDIFYAAQNFLYSPTSLISNCLNAICIPSYQSAKDKARFSYSYLFMLIISMGVIGSIVGVFAGPASASVFAGFSSDSQDLLKRVVILSLPVVFLIPIAAFFDNLNKAEKILFYGNLGRLVNVCLSLIFLIILVAFGVFGMTISAIIGIIGEFLVLAIFFFRRYKFSRPLDLSESLRVMVKSIPVIIGGILSVASLYFERYLASFLASGTITLHSMALSINGILRTVLVGSIVGVYYPFISELIIAEKKDEYEKLQKKIKTIIFGFLGCLMIIACSISLPLFQIVYGHGKFNPEYVQKLAQQFNILAFSVIYSATGNINTFIYYSKFETNIQQVKNAIIAVMTAVIQWCLLGTLGIKALALGAVIALAISLILDYYILLKRYKYRIYSTVDFLALAITLVVTSLFGFLLWSPFFLTFGPLYYIFISRSRYGLNYKSLIPILKKKRI
jgi:peptidoglycan biosynthesis protein MviN/MurJ (putative lipid II flippase)